MSRFARLTSSVATLCACLFPLASGARAQSWSATATTGSWNTAGNWTPAVIPSSSNTTQLTFGTSAVQTVFQDIVPSFTLNALTFSVATGNYVVNSADLTTNGLNFSGANPAITQNAPASVTINAPVTFSASGSISGSGGPLTITDLNAAQGTVTVNRNVTVGTLRFGLEGSTTPAVVTTTGGSAITLTGNLVFNAVPGAGNVPAATVNGVINLTAGDHSFVSHEFSNNPTPPFIDFTINAIMSGPGNFIKVGDDVNNSAWLLINAQNTYTGSTTLRQSSERTFLGVNNALPATTALSIEDFATLFLTNDNNSTTFAVSQQVASLTGTSQAVINLGNNAVSTGVLTVGDANASVFAGQITGGGSIVKVGTGPLTLSNNNNYLGSTTINAGTLYANNPSGSATGVGPVTVASNGTLSGNGFIVPNVGNAVTVNGKVAPGTATIPIGTLTVGSATTLASVSLPGTYTADLGDIASSTSDRLIVNGVLNLTGGTLVATGITGIPGGAINVTYILATASTLTGTFANTANIPLGANVQYDTASSPNRVLLIVPVPEPMSVIGICAVVTAVGGIAVRRRKSTNLIEQIG